MKKNGKSDIHNSESKLFRRSVDCKEELLGEDAISHSLELDSDGLVTVGKNKALHWVELKARAMN